MNKPNVLVTGGAGFIGSHVVDQCIANNFNVIVLDDLSGGFKENINPHALFIKGSVTDYNLVNTLFIEYNFKFVYHLAAYAAEGLSHFIRRFNYNNNLVGTVNLINASINTGSVERFVFTSSIAVYGAGQVPMTEELTPIPEDPYGIAKYAMELDLKSALHLHGLNYTIFRPHNVYGERQNIADRYRNVIGIFMNQIMKDEELTVFGDGTQTRAFSHVDNVAPIIASCVFNDQAKNEVFNIGAEKPYTIIRLAEIIGTCFNKTPKINFLDARQEVVHAFSDHKKLERVFGKQTYIDLEIGIKKMTDWAIAVGPQEPSIFENIEVPLNMPPSWAKFVK